MTGLTFAVLVAAFGGHIWYMFPLCLVISLVYQATRREDLADVVRSGIRLFVVISVGMTLAALLLFAIASL